MNQPPETNADNPPTTTTMDSPAMKMVITMLSSDWQYRYLAAKSDERWVLPPNETTPTRQIPSFNRFDSLMQLNGQWMLCSSNDGVRREVIIVDNVVEKVLSEYLEARKSNFDTQVLCSNLSRKYRGILAADAEWIIEKGKPILVQIEESFPPKVTEIVDNQDATPRDKAADLKLHDDFKAVQAKVASYLTTIKEVIPSETLPNVAPPKSPNADSTRQKQLRPAPSVASLHYEMQESVPKKLKQSVPLSNKANLLNRHKASDSEIIYADNNINPTPAKTPIKPKYVSQDEENWDWQPASTHKDPHIGEAYVAFRVVKGWAPQPAYKQSHRWHRQIEVRNANGEKSLLSEYDEEQVNTSNVIRGYTRSVRFATLNQGSRSF